VLDVQRVRDEFIADHLRDATLALDARYSGREIGERTPGGGERESNLEAGKRQALDHARDVLRLRPFGSQEFATRGYVEEQVAHLDGRSDGMRRRRG
jgi:hypothetical protein